MVHILLLNSSKKLSENFEKVLDKENTKEYNEYSSRGQYKIIANGPVVEVVDTRDLKSLAGNSVSVRVRPGPPDICWDDGIGRHASLKNLCLKA